MKWDCQSQEQRCPYRNKRNFFRCWNLCHFQIYFDTNQKVNWRFLVQIPKTSNNHHPQKTVHTKLEFMVKVLLLSVSSSPCIKKFLYQFIFNWKHLNDNKFTTQAIFSKMRCDRNWQKLEFTLWIHQSWFKTKLGTFNSFQERKGENFISFPSHSELQANSFRRNFIWRNSNKETKHFSFLFKKMNLK